MTTFAHEALLYRSREEFASATASFIEEGLEAEEPVMVAAPRPQLDVLREQLGGASEEVKMVDMGELGRNPGRILPALRGFVDEQESPRVRLVSEPIWAGRRDCETVEAVRHEALANLAFSDLDVAMLCPYDASALGECVLRDAERTHPTVCSDGSSRASDGYTDPAVVWAAADQAMPEPPPSSETLKITGNLAEFRRFVARRALTASMRPERIEKLVLAACEGATNALLHGKLPTTATVWTEEDEFVCEIVNGPAPLDPLAGRLPPDSRAPGGRGLWMINQLCDLVELRSSETATALRLRMALVD
jgi:anti-sigma regulatory factor (Ser/Thr protein kinase)